MRLSIGHGSHEIYLLDRNQSNFHVLYYFYDGLDSTSKLKQYHLPPGRRLRYLRISEKGTERKRSFKVRNDPRGNVVKFEELKENLKILEMEEYYETIWKILAAILTLGEIRFVEGNNGEADMDNNDAATKGISAYVISIRSAIIDNPCRFPCCSRAASRAGREKVHLGVAELLPDREGKRDTQETQLRGSERREGRISQHDLSAINRLDNKHYQP